MRAAPPITIEEANLTSNVPIEMPSGAWNAAVNYGATGAVVSDGGNTYRDISLGSNLNHQPSTSPTYWEALPLPLWNSGVTYALGDRALALVVGGSIDGYSWFRSRQAGNTNHQPPSNPAGDAWWDHIAQVWPIWFSANWTAGSTVTWQRGLWRTTVASTGGTPAAENWEFLGPANRWAMFDTRTSTQTRLDEDIVIEIAVSGRINAVGLLDLDATAVRVQLLDGASSVFDEELSLVSTAGITSWFSYFMEPVSYARELVVDGLPLVLDPTLIVTVIGAAGSERGVGHLTAGMMRVIGITEFGFTTGIDDYSRFETDEFGNRYLDERGYTRRGDFRAVVPVTRHDWVATFLADNRAKPMLIVGSELHSSTVFVGIFKNSKLEGAKPVDSILTTTVEGF